MAIENLPIVFAGNYEDVVGRIDLNERIEEYLKEGFQFILGASIEYDGNNGRRVVGLFLVPPKKEESEQ